MDHRDVIKICASISHQVRRACQERGAQIKKTMEVVEKKVELELKKQKEEKIKEGEEKENVMKRTS